MLNSFGKIYDIKQFICVHHLFKNTPCNTPYLLSLLHKGLWGHFNLGAKMQLNARPSELRACARAHARARATVATYTTT